MTTGQQDRIHGLVGSVAVKAPVRVATTGANITLSGEQTIDGVAVVTGDDVLVKDQTNPVENGLWTCDTGDWERRQDFDGAYDVVKGTSLLVLEGTANNNSYWQVTTENDVVPGTSSLTFEAAMVSSSALLDFIQNPGAAPAVSRTAQSKMRDIVSIFDYMTAAQVAAVQAGTAGAGTGITAAVTTAIARRISEGNCWIFFPDGVYYFNTPVEINVNSQAAVRLEGTSAAGFFSTRPGGTRFTGTAAIESILTITKTNLGLSGAFSFSCRGIDFKSLTYGAAGPARAILNKVAGSPARPFVVNQCNFVGFDSAIESDLTTAVGLNPGLTTGICQVVITECSFVANNYALYGHGGAGAIMDLCFHDNVAENGGSIKTGTLALGGTFMICDNLMEGNTDAIDLSMGLATGEISRNYFEGCSGNIIKCLASNSGSSVKIGPNYILSRGGSPYATVDAYISNMHVNFIDYNPDTSAVVYLENCHVTGWMNAKPTSVANKATGIWANICTASEAITAGVPSVGATGHGTTRLQALVTDTPTGTLHTQWGDRDYHSKTTGTSKWTNTSLQVDDDQTLVMVFTLEYVGTTPGSLYIQAFDGATGKIDAGLDIAPEMSNGTMVLVVCYKNNTGASFNINNGLLHPFGSGGSGTGCKITHGVAYTCWDLASINPEARILPYIPRS